MNRNLTLLALSLLIWGIGEGMFFFFQPLYLQQLGADPMLIGTILGVVGIAMTVAHLPAGYLADRVGRRPLIMVSWYMGIVATWIMALAPSLAPYTVGAAIYGLTVFATGPLSGYVTTARGKLSVERALTLVFSFFSAGGIIGPILGGWIGETMGLKMTYLIAAILFIPSTLLMFFIESQPRIKLTPEQQSAGQRSLFKGRFSRYLGIVFFITFVIYLPQPLSQNFLQNQRGMSLAVIGQMGSVLGLGVVICNLILGQLKARWGYRLAIGIVGIYTLLIWLGKSYPYYLLGYFCMGAFRTARALSVAQGRSLVSNANMGLAYGMIETVSFTAVILAPPVAGWLYTHNPEWIYSVSFPLIIIGLVVNILLTPQAAEEEINAIP